MNSNVWKWKLIAGAGMALFILILIVILSIFAYAKLTPIEPVVYVIMGLITTLIGMLTALAGHAAGSGSPTTAATPLLPGTLAFADVPMASTASTTSPPSSAIPQ